MTSLLRLVCIASLAFVLPLRAATSLSNLANERAAIILTVHDVPSLLSQWEQSPWAKTWNDEQVKRFFAPLRAKWKVDDWNTSAREKTGYTLNELLAFASGDIVVVLPDLEFLRETPAKTPSLLIGVEVGDNAAKLEELLVKSTKDENATDETSEFSGVTIHLIHPAAEKSGGHEATAWAIVEGKWLLSPSKDSLQSAIDAVKSGGVDNPWGKSEKLARLQQRVGTGAQVSLVVNAETIYPAIQSLVEAQSKAGAEKGGGPFNFDPQAILAALGLDVFRDIYVTAQLGETSTDIHAGVTFSEQRGLVKLLAYHDGPPQAPAFVSPKWISVSTAKFSLKEAYAALEEMLESFNPGISGLVQGQIRNFNKQLGIDIKRDLVGSLGDSVIAANTVSPNALPDAIPSMTDFEQVFAISLDNPTGFVNAVESIKHSMGPQADSLFKSREYLGQQIVTLQNPGPARGKKGFSYAIAKGYLFVSIGSAAPLETALQGLASNQSSLWQKPEVAAAFAQMPANASAFQYQDVRAMISSIFQTLTSAATMMNRSAPAPHPAPGEEENENSPPTPISGPAAQNLPFDPEAKPDPAAIAKYWSHSWGYAVRESSGIHITSQIVYPK